MSIGGRNLSFMKDTIVGSKETSDKQYKRKKGDLNGIRKRMNQEETSTKKKLFVSSKRTTTTGRIPSHDFTTASNRTTISTKYTKLRIPITVMPQIQYKNNKAVSTHSSISTTSNAKKTQQIEKENRVNKSGKNNDLKDDTWAHNKSQGGINLITTKFLSSSVASTNIMDTSELPVSKYSGHTIIEDHSVIPTLSQKDKNIGKRPSNSSEEEKVHLDLQPKEFTQIDPPLYKDRVGFENTIRPNKNSNEMYQSNSWNSPTSFLNGKITKENTVTYRDSQYHDPNNVIEQKSLQTSSKPLIDITNRNQGPFTSTVFNDPEQTSDRNNHGAYGIKQDNMSHKATMYSSNICPSSLAGGLSWNATKANTLGVTSCPKFSNGFAFRRCDANGSWVNEDLIDLSHCVSNWLSTIMTSLEEQTGDQKSSIVYLSNMMAQYAIRNHFKAGDISHLIQVIQKLIDSLRIDLELIPTSAQRSAVITQVVQNVIKTGSVLIDHVNHDVWKDLGEVSKQLETLSAFVTSLEDVGLLLPEAAGENKEVTIASDNIRKFNSLMFD